MAYSRFVTSDVYVYMDVAGHLACCGCPFDGAWVYDSTQAMIDHLALHREAGHRMPDNIEECLRRDDEENFPPQCAGGHTWGEPFHPYPNHEFVSDITRRKCEKCGWEL